MLLFGVYFLIFLDVVCWYDLGATIGVGKGGGGLGVSAPKFTNGEFVGQISITGRAKSPEQKD